MKFAVATTGFPNSTSGGGALTAFGVIKSILREGHEAAVLSLYSETMDASLIETESKEMDALGVERTQIPMRDFSQASVPPALRNRIKGWFAPPLDAFYPSVHMAEALKKPLAQMRPDAVFVYHFDALPAVLSATEAPLFAGVGDPTHLPAYYRWRQTEAAGLTPHYLRSALKMAFRSHWTAHYMRKMLNACAASGAFAAHHAAWLQRIGVHRATYLQTPLIDNAGTDWKAKRDGLENKKIKILLIGHMKGVATVSGLYLFANAVLPILERELGPDRYEVHLVGGHEPPADLKQNLSRPGVIFRGHLRPADNEFFTSDILVVPTPVPLGIRVRILTGFSFGACIATHAANQNGTPELKNRENAMISTSGEEMAAQIVELANNPSLRAQLEQGARRTYESSFSLETAGARIVKTLEEIAVQSVPMGK